MAKRCWKCGAEYEGPRRPGFHDACPRCLSWWSSCMNCKRYDEAIRACKSPHTEPIADPETPNFCDDFELADRPAGEAEGSRNAAGTFDDLFKD